MTATDLALTARHNTPKIEIPLEYQRHARVFSEEESHRFPPSRSWDHAIEFKPNTPDSINCKIYPLPEKNKQALHKWLDEEEAKGYLRKSTSPVTSSFFQIPKKDRELRPVQDYRIINSYTVKNNAPLPNIKESISALANSFIFSTFDIRWG